MPDRDFARKFEAASRRLGLTGRAMLAVSGGADSAALLRAALLTAEATGIRPVVAHFDHGLRPDSAADADWVVRLCGELGVECHVGRPEAVSPSEPVSEAAFRERRYRFLRDVAARTECRTLATAHTADDQAETILHHLLRGTGLRGLAGIPERRRLGRNLLIMRPMLGISRAEVERFLIDLGQPYLVDPTNASSAFTRNRLRHEELPRLRDRFNPKLDETLARLGRQAGEIADLVRKLACRRLRESLVSVSDVAIRLDVRKLARQPKPIVREALVLVYRKAGWPRQRMGFEHWERLAELVLRGGRATFPGPTDVRCRRGELVLTRRNGDFAPRRPGNP